MIGGLLGAILLLAPGADPGTEPGFNLPQATHSPFTEAVYGPCNPDCPSQTLWVNGEYLLWWTQKGPLPVPLVTQGSAANINPGALGQPGTSVLYGGQGINFGAASGVRITAGLLLVPEASLSLEGGWFILEKSAQNFSAHSDASGYPVYAQPIINASSGGLGSEAVSLPNPFGFAGGLQVSSTSRLQGWDANLGFLGWSLDKGGQFVLLAGFRSLDLLESLTIQGAFQDVSGVPGGAGLTYLGALETAGGPLSTEDRFRTSNIFYGGQVGGRYTQTLGIFTMSFQGKLALGCTNEIVTVSGYSAYQAPGQSLLATTPGGVLTQLSNIGRHYRDQFAVAPEGTVNFGAQLTSWMRATVGYNVLYWSQVVRPGNEVNLLVNRFNIPTDQNYGLGPASPGQPAFSFHSSAFWAQGVNLGLQFSF